jgi:hypothetical protein
VLCGLLRVCSGLLLDWCEGEVGELEEEEEEEIAVYLRLGLSFVDNEIVLFYFYRLLRFLARYMTPHSSRDTIYYRTQLGHAIFTKAAYM